MIGRLFRLAHAAFLNWLVDIDNKELMDRSREGSASDVWSNQVIARNNERLDKADGLRLAR